MDQNTNSLQTTVTQSSTVNSRPKTNNFLVTLLSILLLLTCIIAGFFAYQTQQLVKELTVYKLQPEETPIATTTPDPIADWKTYIDSNFTFKYPNSWKIEVDKNLIKVFLVGYFEDTFFTIEKIDISPELFFESESKLIGCKLNLNNIQLGVDKKITIISAFNECKGNNYGYYYLKNTNYNVLIRHSLNDSMSNSSVGAILSTFKFIEPVAVSSPLPVACTEEAKICPDGSAVGRSGPKCEFEACPTPKN